MIREFRFYENGKEVSAEKVRRENAIWREYGYNVVADMELQAAQCGVVTEYRVFIPGIGGIDICKGSGLRCECISLRMSD